MVSGPICHLHLPRLEEAAWASHAAVPISYGRASLEAATSTLGCSWRAKSHVRRAGGQLAHTQKDRFGPGRWQQTDSPTPFLAGPRMLDPSEHRAACAQLR